MDKKMARKCAILMVMLVLPMFTSGCGGLLGGIVGGAGRLIGGAGRLLGAGVGALVGGFRVVNDGPLTGGVATQLPGAR